MDMCTHAHTISIFRVPYSPRNKKDAHSIICSLLTTNLDTFYFGPGLIIIIKYFYRIFLGS
jgi:hypothetical protein